MSINSNHIFKLLVPFLYTVIIAKIVSLIILFNIPHKNLKFNVLEQTNVEYNKYFIQKNYEVIIEKKEERVKKEEPKPVKKEYLLVSNIELQAVYANDDETGFILIFEKDSKLTHMLSAGEYFKDYQLKKVFTTYVIFQKNGMDYKLSMNGEENQNTTSVNPEENSQNNIAEKSAKVETAVIVKDSTNEIVQKDEDNFQVKQQVIQPYLKDFTKIWEEVKIKEIKTNGGIDGFKVHYISGNSVLNKLGLKTNDIIKSVNNIKLKSYADAFKLYNQMSSIKSLNFIIQRNNQELELYYEIK